MWPVPKNILRTPAQQNHQSGGGMSSGIGGRAIEARVIAKRWFETAALHNRTTARTFWWKSDLLRNPGGGGVGLYFDTSAYRFEAVLTLLLWAKKKQTARHTLTCCCVSVLPGNALGSISQVNVHSRGNHSTL